MAKTSFKAPNATASSSPGRGPAPSSSESNASKDAVVEEGDSLEEALAKLTPEETEMFMQALDMTMRKRRLMLAGNLLTLLALVIGMLVAFVVYGSREPGSFVGWVFLLPFAAGGFCMWLFGRLARRVRSRPLKPGRGGDIIGDAPSQL